MNFHLCLSIPINSLWAALEMKARSPEKFMDLNLDQSYDRRDHVFSIRHCTVARRAYHYSSRGPQFARESYQRNVWTYSRSSRLHVRMSKKSGWNHGCDPPSQVQLGKSTHIESRDVVGSFSSSFFHNRGMLLARLSCRTDAVATSFLAEIG